MSGGLMQLVAYGAQDIFLTGSPQITYFKKIQKRHTNFSIESIEQTFQGTADWGKRVNVTVSRNADLITRTYLQVDIPAVTVTQTLAGGTDLFSFQWATELGHFLIDNVEVTIGGQSIDKHYGTWMSIWQSLTLPTGKATGYSSMISVPGLTLTVDNTNASTVIAGKTLYIPLQFWFCRNVGLALPLIALQYHEVKFTLQFAAVADLYTFTQSGGAATVSVPSMGSASLFIDYIYLDTAERQKFAQAPHEYLIEQVQHPGSESLSGQSNKVRLSFNHPCKELVWVVQNADRKLSNFTDANSGAGVNPTESAKLQINGHDRFSQRAGAYFNLVQPYQHHTNIPATGINVYSFALQPEEHQPSGSLNMSRIDTATLALNLTANGATASSKVLVFAPNYNVLRIKSGMGGLAFSS